MSKAGQILEKFKQQGKSLNEDANLIKLYDQAGDLLDKLETIVGKISKQDKSPVAKEYLEIASTLNSRMYERKTELEEQD